MHEVHEHLAGLEPGADVAVLGRAVRHDHDLAVAQDLVQVGAQPLGQVRDLVLDEAAVRAQHALHVHVGVVQQHAVALADQRADHAQDGALAQVVGPGLEGQAEHADAPALEPLDEPDGLVHVEVVRARDGLDDRHLRAQHARPLLERPHVLGQAGAAVGEARLEVVGAQVEPRVAHEQVHHQVAVDPLALADAAHLVGEHHLERVVGVVDVLHDLRGPQRHHHRRAADALVEPAQDGGAALLVRADHRELGLEEVADGGALAQELRVVGHAEVPAGHESRGRLEDGRELALHAAGQHRAAHHHHGVGPGRAQRAADLLHRAPHVGEVEAAGGAARRAHAHQHRLGAGEGLGDARGGAQPAGGAGPGDQLAETGLHDRALAPLQAAGLVLAGVHAHDAMTAARQAGRAHRPHVTQSHHHDTHAFSSRPVRSRGMRTSPRPMASRATPARPRSGIPPPPGDAPRACARTHPPCPGPPGG